MEANGLEPGGLQRSQAQLQLRFSVNTREQDKASITSAWVKTCQDRLRNGSKLPYTICTGQGLADLAPKPLREPLQKALSMVPSCTQEMTNGQHASKIDLLDLHALFGDIQFTR